MTKMVVIASVCTSVMCSLAPYIRLYVPVLTPRGHASHVFPLVYKCAHQLINDYIHIRLGIERLSHVLYSYTS